MRTSARLSLVALLLLIIATAAMAWFANAWLTAPIAQLEKATLYEVPRGAALTQVLNDLHKRGLIAHPRGLSVWVRFLRRSFTLKAGEYDLQPGLTPVTLIDLFNSGKVVLHKITIVEGITANDLRNLLADEPAIKAASRQLSANELMHQLNSTAMHPEGQFFPDTYYFAKGATDLDVLRMANERLRKELDRAWAQRDPGLPLTNAYEALILASIVEKETGLASERSLIAGVFIERLRKGMRLETDPTVIYGMGDRFDGDLRSADLRRDTPYNTRTRAGLPPTPICLPSAAALDAVLHPKVTGALYFVATGKGDGSSYFSRTLEEHNAAVARYLKVLRQH